MRRVAEALPWASAKSAGGRCARVTRWISTATWLGRGLGVRSRGEGEGKDEGEGEG